MTDKHAPLSILTFKAGTLLSDFTEGNKQPGIYGTIMNPIELLDPLTIKNGVNIETVRFAAQFTWNQSTLKRHIKAGNKIFMSGNLLLSVEPPTDNEERI